MTAIRAELAGFVAPGWGEDGRLLFDVSDPATMGWARSHAVQIADARTLQAAAASAAEQFERHGFALLPHRTAVTDWDAAPGPAPELFPVLMNREKLRPSLAGALPHRQTGPTLAGSALADSEVARIYFPEIEALVHERLLPGRPVMVQQFTPPLRRGRDTRMPAYGRGVHQDFGLTPDDYVESVEAYTSPEVGRLWHDGWSREDVEGFMVIDFWRTTNMDGPLAHMPLALCDPACVDLADVVPTGLVNFSPTGRPTNNLGLRWRKDQRWRFYPGMREDEVLAFKLFEARKDDAGPVVRGCFHAAFADPGAPQDAQPRQSCEHRVAVWLLNA